MIKALIETLCQWNLDPQPDFRDLADILWLAGIYHHRPTNEAPVKKPLLDPYKQPLAKPEGKAGQDKHKSDDQREDTKPVEEQWDEQDSQQPTEPDHDLYSPGTHSDVGARTGSPYKIPVQRAIPKRRALLRALRPLIRNAASHREGRLDEIATANTSAESRHVVPIFGPTEERWLELVFITENALSMVAWEDTLRELNELLASQGVFRAVRHWTLDATGAGIPCLKSAWGRTINGARDLGSSRGRCLLLIASDCISTAWDDGRMQLLITQLGRQHPLGLLQLMPESLWAKTGLRQARFVKVTASRAVQPNAMLRRRHWRSQRSIDLTGTPLPLFNLDPEFMSVYLEMLAGKPGKHTPAVILPTESETRPVPARPTDPEEHVDYFRANATKMTFELCRYLAAAPLTLPIMQLVQRVLLPQSSPYHLAEVITSGLLDKKPSEGSQTNQIEFQFKAGIREELLKRNLLPDLVQVQRLISDYIDEQGYQSGLHIDAILENPEGFFPISGDPDPFAKVTLQVLEKMGSKFQRVAMKLSSKFKSSPSPSLSSEEVDNQSNYGFLKPPITDTYAGLAKILARKPVLWVGAGASVPSGYPTTGQLLQAMADACDDPLDLSAAFPDVAQQFAGFMGKGALQALLNQQINFVAQPGRLHEALARLALAGSFHAVVTTNYDDLLERAFKAAGVDFQVQVLERNGHLHEGERLRLTKLHGDAADWAETILTKDSYEAYGQRYGFLTAQLEVTLRQHPLLLVGCSLEDPRLLDWLGDLDPAVAENLQPWRPVMRASAWAGLAKHAAVLGHDHIRPLVYGDHDELPRLFEAQVAELPAQPDEVLELVLHDGAVLEAELEGRRWPVADPRGDAELQRLLRPWADLCNKALPTDRNGELEGDAHQAAAQMEAIGRELGRLLTQRLLDEPALQRIRLGLRGSEALLLRLRVKTAGEQGRAEQLLALPWELLLLDDVHPVALGRLLLERRAGDVGELDAPPRDLNVLVCIAAPIDAGALNHEEESLRLWHALARDGNEHRFLETELGSLTDLVEMYRYHEPLAVHFSGHGAPGHLFFEHDTAEAHRVSAEELIARFAPEPPRLLYLSCSHGAGGAHTAEETSLTAARLQRAGVGAIVAYNGPVGDALASQSSAAYYRVLAEGGNLHAAVRAARLAACQPLRDGARCVARHPMGWAQLQLYNRLSGPPVLAPAQRKGGPDMSEVELRRQQERLSYRPELAGVQRQRFGFVGRRASRAALIRAWRSGQRRLVIHGLGGLGKTALATEVIPSLARAQGRGDDLAVLALDGRAAGGSEQPIGDLWQQLSDGGMTLHGEAWGGLLGQIQEQTHTLDGRSLTLAIRVLAEVCGGLLVYMNDVECLQHDPDTGKPGRWHDDDLRRFIATLREACSADGRLGLLASSRYLPEGWPESEAHHLPVLPLAESLRLMRWFPALGKLSSGQRSWLANRVDGHPRTLELLDGLMVKHPGGDPAELLGQVDAAITENLALDTLWRGLDKAEQDLMARLAQLDEAQPQGALEALGGTTTILDRLRKMGLLSPISAPWPNDRWWSQHLLVARHIQQLTTTDETELNRQLGDWYNEQWQASNGAKRMIWTRRAAQHLLRAGDSNGAWPATEKQVIQLRNQGRYREAMAILEPLLAGQPSGEALGMAFIFQTQIEGYLGQRYDAQEVRLFRAYDLVGEANKGFAYSELGTYYHERGQLKQAAAAHEKGALYIKKYYGRESDEYASSLHQLAMVQEASGELSAARARLEESISIKQQVRGIRFHPDVAKSLHQLASVQQAMGDLGAARTNLEESLAIQQQVYNTRIHPSVAASLHQLATVQEAAGDLNGSRANLEESLAILQQVHGTSIHPSVAASLHQLGTVLAALGDLSGARANLEESLAIQQQVYGTRIHPDVAASLHQLSSIQQAEGDLSGARANLEESLAIQRQVYGEDHYSSAISETNLAVILLEAGETEAGLARLTHALQVLHEKLGPEHPTTQQVLGLFKQLIPDDNPSD